MMSKADLADAVDHALAGKWREAHEIVEEELREIAATLGQSNPALPRASKQP
jgi:hypothetical protein